jgi:hypothetical protein
MGFYEFLRFPWLSMSVHESLGSVGTYLAVPFLMRKNPFQLVPRFSGARDSVMPLAPGSRRGSVGAGACGGDAGSTNGSNPLLINTSAPDLHIQPGSPAKDNGVVISAAINGSTDIDGNARIVNNKISKGASQ